MARLVTISEAAKHFDKSRRTIERWINNGAPFEKIRGRRHVDLDAVNDWRRFPERQLFIETLEQACHGGARALWVEYKLDEAQFLAAMLDLFERFERRSGREVSELPVELRHVMSRLAELARHKHRGV